MVTKRLEPVSYRPFQVEPVLADGLLPVARQGGELLQRASEGLFRMAAQAGQIADREAARQGALAGEQAALAGRPEAGYEPGETVGGHGKARGGSFAPEVNAAIDEAAAETGEDATTLRTIAQIESGGNPRAKNPSSTAGGLFQQLDANARQYGVGNKFNAKESALGAAKFMRDNRKYLRAQLGREPTPGELYLAHQQGPGGAAALLKNPDKSAVSIVGAPSVRLNGGQPGMTAGQFAKLWINKAENGYVQPSSPDQIVSLGKLQTAGGTYRPSGEDTIRGRAYDEAGTKVYLQQVDSEMRSTTQQVFEKYRDDPAQLEKALGDLKGTLKNDHIFPEIEADYDVGFDRLAGSYLGQARENLAKKVELQQRANFIEQTGQLETDQAKQLAAFDPNSPDAGDAIASAQASIDQHYDAAVQKGIMDPDDAAKAKLESRRNSALGYYGKQAEALDADGVKTMREEMQRDMADGGIAGLDGDGWSTLDAGLQRLEKSKRSQAVRGENDFRERGDKMALRLLQGVDVNPGELSAYMMDAGSTPGGKAVLQETLSKISAGRAIRDFSLPDAEKHVAGLRKQFGQEPTDAELRTLAFAEKMVADKRRDITTDSVSYAERQGIVPETPPLTDAGTAEDMSAIMSQRAKSAEQAATELGVPVRYLKAGEAVAIGKMVRADPANGAAMAGAIVAGAGNAAPQVLAEFGKDAPMIAESGAIVAFGGSPRAAEDVILGYGKGADGKQMKGLKPDAAKQSFAEVTGNALELARDDSGRIERAAASIARKRISEEGLDPTSDEAAGVHAQAVQEAAGAVFDRGVQFGGFTTIGGGYFSAGQKVLVPSEIRADRFEDLLHAVTDDDLKTLRHLPKAGIGFFGAARGGDPRFAKSPAATIRNATPVAVDGGFAFAAGDINTSDPQWIMAEDGRPFILDLVAMRDRLEARVPGAFR
ncbi:MAG: lytic transglycosylase domain-containing protein [Mesorhizobium sp.]|uniref:transglycosylase SLT domain-containing protein n=1 Tax=Mesorhizobium sp. TaxID=1871066 RepID=UPI000FE8222A|nr:transglycosylase SLT domain-containing protein [Mesorhizobium sp.]RWN47183.1 MAG: lytic transglycosylase domain-containing protein [Mesorhizobium sp.]